MKLTCAGTKKSPAYYIQKSVRIGNKTTTKTVERLGSIEEIKARCGDMDPIEWAKEYTKKLTLAEKQSKQGILLKYSASMLIDKNVRRSCNVGYLFLQDIYYSLGIHKICDSISDKYKFDYDLNGILSMLVYGIFSRSVASVRCRLLPFPSFLSAISGKHTGVGEILPAGDALVHYLVDFPYLPLFRLVKSVV